MSASTSTFRLVIGNKNYSSWSLRPWLVLRQLGVPFQEQVISLYDASRPTPMKEHSPSGRVPALYDGALCIWDSLAICEYLAELFPDRGLWPSDRAARAVARSVSNEMHSGFTALRTHMPMNVRKRQLSQSTEPGVAEDIARVQEIWQDCRARYGAAGQFLFGQVGIADAMYAPVVLRFQTYGVQLSAAARRYSDSVLALPAMQEWAKASQDEPWVLPQYEKQR